MTRAKRKDLIDKATANLLRKQKPDPSDFIVGRPVVSVSTSKVVLFDIKKGRKEGLPVTFHIGVLRDPSSKVVEVSQFALSRSEATQLVEALTKFLSMPYRWTQGYA